MRTVFAKVALAALCATALTAVSHSAFAGTVTITGSTLSTAPNPLYGSVTSENNVVNSPGAPSTGSILNDPTGPTLTPSTPWVQQGQVSANVGASPYFVTWYFTGSESGYNITLTAPNVNFTEGNQNNSAYAGGPPLTNGSYQILGTSAYSAGSPLAFQLTWAAGPNGSVDNSGTQAAPGNGLANLIFSYVDISTYMSTGLLNLTTQAGDWFAFALNDNGGSDDNHDDFVGFAQITTTNGGPGLTPIPAALPLFGSVIGGGLAFGKWRRRRKQQQA
ncbi:MAG: hypothetical protein ACTHKE_12640 [Sphingomicrobium sp.]